MQTGFTFAGIILGSLTGYKMGVGGWVLAGAVGLVVELIVGVCIIHAAHTSAPPWAAGIGGLILGNAVGSLAHVLMKF